MRYELYLITNNINNMRYVGQVQSTRGYLKRFKQHIYTAYAKGKKSLLHAAIRSYGPEAFSVKRIIHDIEETDIDRLEAIWICRLNTYYLNGYGYNMTLGGQGVHGYMFDDRARELRRERSRLFWESLRDNPEALQNFVRRRAEIRQKNGKPRSPVQRLHYSEAALKRFENCPGTFTGKRHTDEAKDAISRANGSRVVAIDLDTGIEVKRFVSAAKAGDWLIQMNKTSNTSANARILTVCKGGGKSAYGYIWKFV